MLLESKEKGGSEMQPIMQGSNGVIEDEVRPEGEPRMATFSIEDQRRICSAALRLYGADYGKRDCEERRQAAEVVGSFLESIAHAIQGGQRVFEGQYSSISDLFLSRLTFLEDPNSVDSRTAEFYRRFTEYVRRGTRLVEADYDALASLFNSIDWGFEGDPPQTDSLVCNWNEKAISFDLLISDGGRSDWKDI